MAESRRKTRIVPATAGDLDDVLAIEAISFSSPWPRESFEEELDRPWAIFRLRREANGTLLAYINYWIVLDEIHLLNLATHPGHRRQGHARALIDEMVQQARQGDLTVVLLEVRRSNRAARNLYEDLGFTRVGVRRRYYSDNGEDALLYSLDIS